MEKDKIITYRIDDTKITNDKNRSFKVFYTLERKNGSVYYSLETFDGKRLNINRMNGYQNMLLNMCFSNFNRNRAIPNEYKDLIIIEKLPRTIKKQINMRYELYKDNAFLNSKEISMYEYMQFIYEEIKEFEKIYGMTVSGNQEEFDDYLKYKVLSKIAEYFASDENSYENLFYCMNRFFQKYEIIDKRQENILDLSMYNRIKLAYDRAFERKLLNNYSIFLEEVPQKLKNKYAVLITLDTTKENGDKIMDFRNKKLILDNIYKLESEKEPIKILIKFSEVAIIFPEVYTLDKMNELCIKAEEFVESEISAGNRQQGTYDKVDFFIIVDNGEKAVLSINDTICIGDGEQVDFKNFLEKFYGSEYLENLENLISTQNQEER